jgi:hypothetical protein
MKHISSCAIALLVCLASMAAEAQWTSEQRQNTEKDCIEVCTTGNLSASQCQSLCACSRSTAEREYPNFSEYERQVTRGSADNPVVKRTEEIARMCVQRILGK